MLYIKLFIEREKNIGQSAPECPFKDTYCAEWLLYIMSLTYGTHLCGKCHTVCAMSTPLCHIANLVNTIRYDIVYLTYTKELTCSQLSPSHRTNWKIKEKELKINREASVWSVPVVMKAVQGRRSIKVGMICWKGRFQAWSERVEEWWMMRAVTMVVAKPTKPQSSDNTKSLNNNYWKLQTYAKLKQNHSLLQVAFYAIWQWNRSDLF